MMKTMEGLRYSLLARISSSALVHNCNLLRDIAGGDCALCAIVKSNAYGHGLDVVLPALREAEVEILSVGSIEEAQFLRRIGWDQPILLLGSEFSIYKDSQKQELAEWLIGNSIRITAANREDLKVLSEAAKKVGKSAVIHLMMDTGMTRMGLNRRGLMEIIQALRVDENVLIEGLYTHMAAADTQDKTFAFEQLEKFNNFLSEIQSIGLDIPFIHAANSASVIDIQDSVYNMIRPGISVYGYNPAPEMLHKPELKPALKLTARLTLVKAVPEGSYIGYGCSYQAERDMKIGVVPIGYYDGYDRKLSNTGHMTIKGHLVPVVGRVTMNQTIIDVTDIIEQGIEILPGTEVTVIDDKHDTPNSVESLARILETVPHEVVARLGKRIKRVLV